MQKPTHEQLAAQKVFDGFTQYASASFNLQAALELKDIEIQELKAELELKNKLIEAQESQIITLREIEKKYSEIVQLDRESLEISKGVGEK